MQVRFGITYRRHHSGRQSTGKAEAVFILWGAYARKKKSLVTATALGN